MELSEWIEDTKWSTITDRRLRDGETRVFNYRSDTQASITDDRNEKHSCYRLCSKERFSMSCPLTDISCSNFVSTSQTFDPFATIQDDDNIIDIEEHNETVTKEAIFDPWQTIHDDDAFITVTDVANNHTSEETSNLSFENKYSPDAKKTNYVNDKTSSNSSRTLLEDENSVYEPLEPFHFVQNKNKWNLWVRLPLATRGKLLLSQSRYWKQVLVKLLNLGSSFVIRLYSDFTEHDLLHELLLLPTYSVYNEGLQVVDHTPDGPKLYAITLYDITYEERLSVHNNNKIFPKFRDITSVNSFQKFRNLIYKMPKVFIH